MIVLEQGRLLMGQFDTCEANPIGCIKLTDIVLFNHQCRVSRLTADSEYTVLRFGTGIVHDLYAAVGKYGRFTQHRGANGDGSYCAAGSLSFDITMFYSIVDHPIRSRGMQPNDSITGTIAVGIAEVETAIGTAGLIRSVDGYITASIHFQQGRRMIARYQRMYARAWLNGKRIDGGCITVVLYDDGIGFATGITGIG